MRSASRLQLPASNDPRSGAFRVTQIDIHVTEAPISIGGTKHIFWLFSLFCSSAEVVAEFKQVV